MTGVVCHVGGCAVGSGGPAGSSSSLSLVPSPASEASGRASVSAVQCPVPSSLTVSGSAMVRSEKESKAGPVRLAGDVHSRVVPPSTSRALQGRAGPRSSQPSVPCWRGLPPAASVAPPHPGRVGRRAARRCGARRSQCALTLAPPGRPSGDSVLGLRRDFSWSPGGNIIAFWVPEDKDIPARVTLMQLPSRQEIRVRNLFNVVDCKLHWQKNGDYLCVKVDRTPKGTQVSGAGAAPAGRPACSALTGPGLTT